MVLEAQYTFIEESSGLDAVTRAIRQNTLFALDLETTGLEPLFDRILLCQIGVPGQTFVVDANRVSLEPLLPYFKSSKWLKLIQNAKFEQKFIKYHYNSKITNVFDTKLAEHLLTSEVYGTSLKALAKKYVDVDLDKDVRKTFGESRPMAVFSQEQLEYAAMDASILIPIAALQREQLKEKGLDKVAEIEFELSQVVADMELTGVPVNVPKWKKIFADKGIEHKEVRERLHQIIFDDNGLSEQMGMFERDAINFNSTKQVKEVFAKLGVELATTTEREISVLNHPAAKELVRFRELAKILSSYGKTFLDQVNPLTQRIHADFQQIGTQTGRMACKSPNLQQIPEEFRACIGHADYDIIAADYSQIELRILGEMSGDSNFIRMFTLGDDIHKATASQMFGVPLASVTKEQRFIAKTINFGLAYGMGSIKLADILNGEAKKNGTKGYTTTQAKGLIGRYKTTFGTAMDWLRDSGEEAFRTGTASTLLGRKRFFTRPEVGTDEEAYTKQVASIKRQGANARIQGGNADITKIAMNNIYQELENYYPESHIVIQVHDEIVILARKRDSAAVKDLVEQSMIDSAQEILTKVPVKVEVTVADEWKKG